LLGPVDNTLVIGAGAGYDVMLALEAGAESVTAVEINPAIVDVTRAQAVAASCRV
jgi:protein-L-isoaspartate O-methyltransferase